MPEIANGHICCSFCGSIRTFITGRPQCTPIIKHFHIIFNRLLCSIDFHISCWRFPTVALIFESEVCYFSVLLLNGFCIFSPQLWAWRSMTDNIYYVHLVSDSFYFAELPKSIRLASHANKEQLFFWVLQQPIIGFPVNVTWLALHIF